MEWRFRAWEAIEKKMLYFDMDDLLSGDVPLHPSSCDWTLMASTGLKAKNDEEIFQHDYIQNESGRICEVVWNKNCGCWDATPVKVLPGDNPDGFVCSQWDSWVTVIGNIHSNPSLLEAQE